MSLGILQNCSDSLLQPTQPALILRLDWTNAWDSANRGKKVLSKILGEPEQALRHGADAVITYLFVGTGDADFEAEEIARNATVAKECERVGLPLIIETIARGSEVQDPRSSEWMKLHTRLAAELGADFIKQNTRETLKRCERSSSFRLFPSSFWAARAKTPTAKR